MNSSDHFKPIAPGVMIGHVHLKAADLERALRFYRDVLGFELTQRFGSQAAFVSSGDYHHHIGLNTWESAGGGPPPPGATGLYHLAIRYPTRPATAEPPREAFSRSGRKAVESPSPTFHKGLLFSLRLVQDKILSSRILNPPLASGACRPDTQAPSDDEADLLATDEGTTIMRV